MQAHALFNIFGFLAPPCPGETSAHIECRDRVGAEERTGAWVYFPDPGPRGGGAGGRAGDAGILRAGCQHIEIRGGGFASSPSALPVGMLGPVWGELKGSGAGVTLPDTAFPGYRHDCPRPLGRGKREAGRGGDAGILRAETGGLCTPRLPHPVEIPPTVQCMGMRPGTALPQYRRLPRPRGEETGPGGVGDADILKEGRDLAKPGYYCSLSTVHSRDPRGVFLWLLRCPSARERETPAY